MKKILSPLLLLVSLSAISQKEYYLLIGTYTSSGSEGIYVYRFSSLTGDAVPVSSINTSNPSFLAVSPNEKFIYAVNENADSTRFTMSGSVAAFSFNKKDGTLSLINKQFSGGKHPCYVSIDKTGKWVFAGNYSSGSLAVLPVRKDGGLDSTIQVIEHEGYSVDADRQQGPHVHATVLSPDNKYLFVPDLGIDKVMIYSFNNRTGQLSPATSPYEISEAGAGPRHFEFHPNGKFAYLMEEMSGSVSVYAYRDGQLTLLQNISAIPPTYTGDIGSADIHVSPDGNFVYASNRGASNTIAIFAVNKNGTLKSIGHQSTLGKTPRNFNFDPTGNFLLVANQNSDEVVIFKRDKKTGLLEDTGKRIAVSKPVCLKWVKLD